MKILKQLCEAVGVSGAEAEVHQLICKLISGHVDRLETDVMGSILAYKAGTAPVDERFTVLVDAHIDEVGLMVTGHTSDGMLRVTNLGGLDDRLLPGLRVLVGPKKLPGVIGVKPVHLLSGSERGSVTSLDNLRVDIGLSSKSAAEGKAPLGTRIVFEGEFIDLGPTVRGKAFDDRAGCAVLVHLLQGAAFPFDLVASFTVQEEVGLRGAHIAAHKAEPLCAFVLEGTIADDLPKDEDQSATTTLGHGPALSVMDKRTIYDRRLNDHIVQTAAALNIPVQFKQPGIGGTNAGAIHLSGAGVPTAVISVPCRYIHGPAAILDKRDYENTITLTRESLMRLHKGVIAGLAG